MRAILASTLLLLIGATLSQAANRVALVIGNSKYANLPDNRQLTSPVADATDVAAALKALGYTIVTGKAVTDAGKDTMLNATETFAQAAKNAEAAVFYYSGHGVQVGEDNYLLPSDAPKLSGISVLKNRAVLLRDAVMVALEEAGAQNKVIVLDCCRDNPFAAQLQTALAAVGKSVGTRDVGEMSGYGPGFYLAFATSPGFTADDGNGRRNSPFTAAMLKNLVDGGSKDIDFFFRDVKLLLGEGQVSWTNHSLRTSFALAPSSTQRGLTGLAMPNVAGSTADPTASRAISKGFSLPSRGFFDLNEVFGGTTYDAYNAYSRAMLLRRAQTKLKEMGCYNGELDGSMGPTTQRAIVAWQERQGLEVTGGLDMATQKSLEMDNVPESKPALASELTGRFIYGKTYADLAGKHVDFTLKLSINGMTFAGVIVEPYTDFGTTAPDGNLHADVTGTIREVKGRTVIRFTKEYRNFDQPIIKYEGTLDASTGLVSGSWNFPASPAAGTFVLKPKP